MSIKRVAIIGGTGFGEAFGGGEPEIVDTPYGEASVRRSTLFGGELVTLARHGAGHTLPPHRVNYRANIAALNALAVSSVLSTAAVGSLQLGLAPGDFVILDDLIDFTRGEVVTFFDQPGNVRHTDMGKPYDPGLRSILIEASDPAQSELIHKTGTYVCVTGPRYETPAEIRMLAHWGGSVVGMTGAPEAILCREIGLTYASIAVVTNYGCGLSHGETLDHGDVSRQMAARREDLTSWLLRSVERILET